MTKDFHTCECEDHGPIKYMYSVYLSVIRISLNFSPSFDFKGKLKNMKICENADAKNALSKIDHSIASDTT